MQSITAGTVYFPTTDKQLMGINVVVTWDTGFWRPGTSDRDVQSALQWWKESHTGFLDWTLQRTRGLMKFLYCTCTSQTLTIITLHLHDSLAVVPMTRVEPFIRETKRWDMATMDKCAFKNVYLLLCTYLLYPSERNSSRSVEIKQALRSISDGRKEWGGSPGPESNCPPGRRDRSNILCSSVWPTTGWGVT